MEREWYLHDLSLHMTDDPLRNPNDPLQSSAPDVSLELFRMMGKLAAGRPVEAIVNAASNLLINAVRQNAVDWRRAEVIFDEVYGRSKQLLKNHYDTQGRKKGIFPYDQVIRPDHYVDPKFHSSKRRN